MLVDLSPLWTVARFPDIIARGSYDRIAMLSPSEDQVEYVLSNMIEMACLQPNQPISPRQVERWAGGPTSDQFFNLIGLKVAERYAARTLDYLAADAIMNDLWSMLLEGIYSRDIEVPDLFYEIYLAFDAGEGIRSPDEDPVRKITDPWIASILSQRRLQPN